MQAERVRTCTKLEMAVLIAMFHAAGQGKNPVTFDDILQKYGQVTDQLFPRHESKEIADDAVVWGVYSTLLDQGLIQLAPCR